MMLGNIVVLASAFAAATALRVPSTHTVHEKRDAQPLNWAKKGRVHPNSILPVRVGLRQQNLEHGHDYLMDVSHPDSPNYGKHWTSEQVVDAFKPNDETVETVKSWLESEGFRNITHSDNKGWLAFNAKAKDVEALLHAEYHEFEDHYGSKIPSCDAYHVPHHVREHIDYITPGLRLLSPGKKPRGRPSEIQPRSDIEAAHTNKTGNLSECWKKVTPACIRALYQLPVADFTPHPNNSFGLHEALTNFYNEKDLSIFYERFSPNIANNTRPQTYSIDGGVASARNFSRMAHKALGNLYPDLYHGFLSGAEALLDLQCAYPIVYPQTVTIWDENDLHYQAMHNDTYTWGFNQMLDAMDGSYCTYSAYGETGDLKGIDPSYPDKTSFGGYDRPLQCGVFKPPNVLSSSYSGQEIDVPVSYQKRQCNEFMKLALQGTTFALASGDTGVGNTPVLKPTQGRDGPTGCLGKNLNAFNPEWPNSCPYITVVGGTMIAKGASVHAKHAEVVADVPDLKNVHNNYSSGGGFSNIFPMPSYQKTLVEHYLKNYAPDYETYSTLSPNLTDPYVYVNVSALQGNGNGLFSRIGRAYPDVSAVSYNIATIIDRKYSAGYGTSAATPIFAAIINRINEERLAAGKGPVGFINPTMYAHPEAFHDIIKGENPGCNFTGFPAAPGWDASSGLGTPIYPKLLEVFMKLP